MALFKSDGDYTRFLTTLFIANGKKDIAHLDRPRVRNLVSDIRDGKVDIGDSLVDIAGFCLMPTHFHLIFIEKVDGNISFFMHKILVSYSKYFNLKYERRGHVFERTFNSKHLSDDEYLMRVLAYIHLNPKDLKRWRRRENKYMWSSFQDYATENRWGKLLKTDFALEYFNFNKRELRNFTETARKADYELNDRN